MQRTGSMVIPWVIGLSGILISVWTWHGLSNLERQALEASFGLDAAERSRAFSNHLEQDLSAVHTLAVLYAVNPRVGRRQFEQVASELLDRKPSIKALEWIPSVADEDRQAFEDAARLDGFPSFRISERLRQGEMVPAARRAFYYPVLFVEPYKGNELALGFDLGSSAERAHALHRAAETAELTLTRRIVLVQEPGENFGFLALRAIVADEEPAPDTQPGTVVGFVMGVFRVSDIVESAIAALATSGIELELLDLSAEPEQRLLYTTAPSSDSSGSALLRIDSMEVGGRRWALRLWPSESYTLSRLSRIPFVALLAGLAMSFLGFGLAQVIFARAKHVRDLVRRRTADLAIANENLANEIRSHAAAEKERQQLARQLQHSQKLEAIGRMAGGVAHDFNNLLMGIRFFTEMARDSMPPENRAREQLNQSLQATERATELVRQILSFSRMHRPQRHPLSLCSAVKDSLKLLRPALPSTVSIHEHLDCASDCVSADVTQIHQVIVNLCTNAADAMARTGGHLDLSVSTLPMLEESNDTAKDAEDGFVYLTVSDTGIGIPPGHLPRIFEPFFTTKEVGEGTGMGLAVVHGIVTNYGGEITVTPRPGGGTAFQVALPQCTESALETPPDEQPVSRGRERILFVDDEEIVARAGKDLLESLGYHVTVFNDGEAALEAFELAPQSYDLAVVDQVMPRMTGSELSKRILARRPDFPIVLCTGYSASLTPDAAKAIGIRRFLIKSVSLRDYARAIREALDESNNPDSS